MSLLCQTEPSVSKGLICKMWLHLKNKRPPYFSFVSHECSPRPTLEASVSLVKGPRFSFRVSSHRCLPVSSCSPTSFHHTRTASHYFISFQPFKMPLTLSHPLSALLGSERIMGINGLYNEQSSCILPANKLIFKPGYEDSVPSQRRVRGKIL